MQAVAPRTPTSNTDDMDSGEEGVDLRLAPQRVAQVEEACPSEGAEDADDQPREVSYEEPSSGPARDHVVMASELSGRDGDAEEWVKDDRREDHREDHVESPQSQEPLGQVRSSSSFERTDSSFRHPVQNRSKESFRSNCLELCFPCQIIKALPLLRRRDGCPRDSDGRKTRLAKRPTPGSGRLDAVSHRSKRVCR